MRSIRRAAIACAILIAALTVPATAHATSRQEALATGKMYAAGQVPRIRSMTPSGVVWWEAFAGQCGEMGDLWACKPVLRYRSKSGDSGRCTWDLTVLAPLLVRVDGWGCVMAAR